MGGEGIDSDRGKRAEDTRKESEEGGKGEVGEREGERETKRNRMATVLVSLLVCASPHSFLSPPQHPRLPDISR